MTKPILSIIIVNYNTKKLLQQCLKSLMFEVRSWKLRNRKQTSNLKHQTSNNLIEIIIVDNNSTDGSKEYLRDLEIWKYRDIDNRIDNKKKGGKNYSSKSLNLYKANGTERSISLKVIFNKQNLGFAKANNQGIKQAQGKYILLLNSDTIVKKGALEKLVEFAEETSDAGVVGPRLVNPDGSIQPSCFHFPSLLGAIKEFWLGEREAFTKYAPRGKNPQIVDAVVGAAFLITPQARKRVGLFDERYFFYFEDLDYCRRVWRAGLKVYYLPGAEIVHLHGASGRKLEGKPNRWLIRSSKIYYGHFRYYLINLIIRLGQKYRELIRR
jgi:hypothetical protein